MPTIKEKIQLAPNDEKLLEKRGYTIGEPLNSGSFACVCRATFNGAPLAVKVIDLEKTSNSYRLRFLPREIYTMTKLKHKHLIEIVNVFVVGNRVIVFMELAEGGDFYDLLRPTRGLPEDRARYFYLQFGDALRYMHSLGFAHRDIKCQNILLNKDRTISKMTDFGFARSCFQKSSDQQVLSATYCGSLHYMAPEILQSKPYNPLACDVWSMGVVLFMLVYNKLPFNQKEKIDLLNNQMNRNYKHVKAKISKQCKNLIDLHFNLDPNNRINMENVLQHEWFGKQRKDDAKDFLKFKNMAKDKIKQKPKEIEKVQPEINQLEKVEILKVITEDENKIKESDVRKSQIEFRKSDKMKFQNETQKIDEDHNKNEFKELSEAENQKEEIKESAKDDNQKELKESGKKETSVEIKESDKNQNKNEIEELSEAKNQKKEIKESTKDDNQKVLKESDKKETSVEIKESDKSKNDIKELNVEKIQKNEIKELSEDKNKTKELNEEKNELIQKTNDLDQEKNEIKLDVLKSSKEKIDEVNKTEEITEIVKQN